MDLQYGQPKHVDRCSSVPWWLARSLVAGGLVVVEDIIGDKRDSAVSYVRLRGNPSGAQFALGVVNSRFLGAAVRLNYIRIRKLISTERNAR